MPGGLINSNQQKQVSQQRRMPVDDISADAMATIAGEVLTLKYYLNGVLTTDAGQAAGTKVLIKLANRNILNAVGDVIGTEANTSFSFGVGTILTSRRAFPDLVAETFDTATGLAKITAILAGFTNGEYCIDHRTGTIYGVKKTNGAADTGSYFVNQNISGGGGGIASDVNITKIAGVALADGAVLTKPLPVLHYSSAILESKAVVKASSGVLYEVRFTNTAGAAQQIQVFNTAAVPADGAVPLTSITCPALTTGYVTYPQGLSCSLGICISNSSTVATKTIGGATCFFEADYK